MTGGLLFRNKVPDLEVTKPIVIGDNVYIGNNVIILPGVTIGDNVIMVQGLQFLKVFQVIQLQLAYSPE